MSACKAIYQSAQGNALGKMSPYTTPCRGKSIV